MNARWLSIPTTAVIVINAGAALPSEARVTATHTPETQAIQAVVPEPASKAPPPETQAPRRLTVTYSDGRIVPRILTPRGGSWSPSFPRRPNAPTRDGLALSALKVDHRIESDSVVVTVSLVYGQPQQRTVHVATVRLRDDQPVEVGELTPFGVDPITLALETAAPAFVVLPKTASVSAMLEVTVDLPSGDLPLYEITLKNRSTKAIAVVGFRAYRGETAVLSGRRRSNRSLPVLEPGGLLRFTTQAARMGEAQGFDRFEVTGVLWADGSLEGEADLETSEQAIAIGYAYQLRRVLALLGESSAASLVEIRSAVGSGSRTPSRATPPG